MVAMYFFECIGIAMLFGPVWIMAEIGIKDGFSQPFNKTGVLDVKKSLLRNSALTFAQPDKNSALR